ncbi:MAG: hypothetical protein HY820_34815 [Acidobacteria bacterium]|nr:hypothetical protein [Acidobacteriota bacterium]
MMRTLPKLLPVLLLALALNAASTVYWEINTYQEFLKGKLQGLSLLRDGSLQIAPRSQRLFTSDQPVIWSIARSPQGHLYVATGHRGQVYRIDPAGKSELYWTAPEPEVFALAIHADGSLFAATSPDGKIYRIRSGAPSEYFAPKSKYIWTLAFAPDGTLYAGTGDEGKVFRITAQGTGEVWYETGQSNVTALAFDAQKRLLAGTEPNGLLYRISAKDQAFVLYDSTFPEIRAIIPSADGGLYLAALGGAFSKKQAGAAGAVSQIGSGTMVTAPTTTITVEAAQVQSGIEIKPKADAPKPAAPTTPQTTAVTAPIVEMSGVDKSALIRIHPDLRAETLWVSKEENIYDLAPSGSEILFATDSQGRVYRLESDRKPTLLLETREGETTRLLHLSDGLLAATSHNGSLLRIGAQPGDAGTYESPVHDATNTARWGRLQWRARTPASAKVALRTRSGNSSRPDKTWSDWSAPIETTGAQIASPNARFIQWKAEFAGKSGNTPQLDSVTIAYLPQNTPPIVKSVTVTSQASAVTTTKASSSTATNAVYSITVSDSTETASTTSSGNPTQTVTRPVNGQIVITWQAEDTDSDKLAYSVFFRGEEESEWKLLKQNHTELALTLDADVFADGRYFFKVIASDAPSNPAADAREGDLVSSLMLIDNTPPSITLTTQREAGGLRIVVDAKDAASAVRRAEYSIDAGPWMTLAPEDGVADTLQERFAGLAATVPAGEHILVVRAYDTAGNAGLAKIILR